MRMSATQVIGLLGGVIVLGCIEGCALKTSDDADRFRQAIPLSNDVALAVPKSSGGSTSSTKSLHTKGGDPSSAKYYQFTRDIADGVDGGTGEILGLVWLIVHSPPTSVSAHKAVWGPGNGDALDPVVYRMTVTEVSTHEYDYVLEGRPKGSTSDGDFRAVLSGHGFGEDRPEHREGWFRLDNDAHNALDPARAHDSRAVRVDFDLRSYPLSIKADVEPSPGKSGYFKVAVTHDKDSGGAVDIAALGDIEAIKDGKLENVALHSRWNASGAGRADVEITGGDLTVPKVDATECWSSIFARVYYTDTASYEPTTGSPSACAFAGK